MRQTLSRSTSVAALAAALLVVTPHAAFAQEPQGDDDIDELFTEEIVITGSRIRRPSQFDTATPLENIGQEELAAIGATTPADIIQTLTINTGSQNNPDAFTQNFNVGTSQFNLRGLGVSSTLVLLNGRRSVLSGAVTNDGNNFVDTNSLVPLIAVDRLEILKDGAAAIYGTDAVAGVVNFRTRNDFEGVELTGQYDNITGDSTAYRIEGLVGVQSDRGGAIVSIAYFDQTELTAGERQLPGSDLADISTVGQPGTFIVPTTPTIDAGLAAIFTAAFDSAGNIPGVADALEPALVPGSPAIPGAQLPAFADPTCGAVSQIDPDVIPPGSPAPGLIPDGVVGLCQFFFGDDYTIVPEVDRFQGFAAGDYEVTDWMTVYAEIGFARNTAFRAVSPSFPVTTPFDLAANNPFNPFNQPVQLLARSLGGGGERSANGFESDTFRGVIGFRGSLEALPGEVFDSWTYDASYIFGINEYDVQQTDVVESRYRNALAGFGGLNCDNATGLPGQGNCFFFNPTGTSFLAQNGLAPATTPFETTDANGAPITIQVPTVNSQEVFDFINSDLLLLAESRFEAYEVSATGELPFSIPGAPAPIAMAIGWQYRDSFFANDYDPVSEEFDFLFLVGGEDFEDQQDVFSGFVEFDIPVHEWLTLNGAVRVEDYGGEIGRTVDPKGSLSFTPTEHFQLRFSGGTSFRAPTVFQTAGSQTSLVQISDPQVSGQTAFLGVRTLGNTQLQPEQARTFNGGVTFEPFRQFNLFSERFQDLQINVDHFRFRFTDIIVQENPQAIVDADPFDPAIERTTAGTIGLINTQFVNASSLRTSGIDWDVTYTIDAGRIGIFRPSVEGTYLLEYELEDPQAGTIDGAGRRNFTNFGTSAPELRMNFGLAWVLDRYSANVFVRRIGSYTDDEVGLDGVTGTEIDSQTTLDVQLNVALPNPFSEEFEGPKLTLGAINITDEDPPTVVTNGGFDSRVHDPRGRIFYLRATQTF